ncbi:d-ribitol-5-phosphate cytidylyltransferase [Trichonephila inaurata madagascariensis]|uniref:D-ribitol-5-phosphate cytidylyltransferase n=1 Tax=Trichonephila inaurata madagascariensis TaxID=2747483 RepID=A0A8X7CEH9_9ARAC|nr:d-ribitol-5-phosphate cytidylyltransferase [Trichonephila inaurata madagascariensis]
MVSCFICSKNFTLNKNLYEHLRSKHKVSPEVPGKILCSFQCGNKFRTHKELRSHLENFHKQPVECETHEFHDYETFELWKKRFEETTGYGYTLRVSEKVLRSGVAKSHLICHRSGNRKSESTGQRRMKKAGSSKIGTVCPSVMEVSRSLSDGKVNVIFWKTHIGHEADPKHTPIHKTKSTKKLEMIDYNVCAILPAAGKGDRMGLETPKQYISIHQKPIICYTVEAFSRLPFIKKVIVVASCGSLNLMLEKLSQNCVLQGEKLMVTEASGTRHESIKSGLKVLQTCCDTEPEIVIVHDGVRPFFPENIVYNLVTTAKEHGAAGITCPLISTVISVDEDGFLNTVLDRNVYKASEMPQAFQYNLILKAYEAVSPFDLENGTECLKLILDYTGIRPKLLPATSHLWKVTHRKDIYTGAAVAKESQSVKIINSNSVPEFLPYLKTALSKTFKNVSLASKFTESSLDKFQNLIFIHDSKNPYNLIENMNILSVGQKLMHLCSIIHIFKNDFDTTINFLEFQKQARAGAKTLKSANILVYIIIWEKINSMQTFEETAELARSLLFDSNPSISGTVFLS